MQEIPTVQQPTPPQQPPMYPPPTYQPPQKPPHSRKRLWLIIGIGLAVILVFSIIGSNIGTQEKTPTTPQATQPAQQVTTQPEPTQAPTETTQPTATPTPIPTIAPISLSGAGQQASHKFQLQDGLAIFKLTHDGTSNFIVHLVNSNGKVVEYLANEIGSFNGSTALGIQSAGTYLLDIEADGKWTVTIQQTRPATAPYTTSFSGKGQTATQLFSLQSGLKIIKMTHDGTSNFIVHILDSNGNVVDYLVNEIGKFDGSKAEGIQDDGIYLFDVQADGDWTITIQ